MFLAGKVEENALHQGQGKILIQGMRSIESEYRYTIDDMILCELQLLHHIDYQLIVFHPHRQLLQYLEDSGMQDSLQVAWSLANDTYQTDLCMRFPPFLIALGCLCLAGIVLNKEAQLRKWFASLNVEMKYVRHTGVADIDRSIEACSSSVGLTRENCVARHRDADWRGRQGADGPL